MEVGGGRGGGGGGMQYSYSFNVLKMQDGLPCFSVVWLMSFKKIKNYMMSASFNFMVDLLVPGVWAMIASYTFAYLRAKFSMVHSA